MCIYWLLYSIEYDLYRSWNVKLNVFYNCFWLRFSRRANCDVWSSWGKLNRSKRYNAATVIRWKCDSGRFGHKSSLKFLKLVWQHTRLDLPRILLLFRLQRRPLLQLRLHSISLWKLRRIHLLERLIDFLSNSNNILGQPTRDLH